MLSPAQSCKLVHVSGAHGHMLVCITCSGCGFVYFTVQSTVKSTVVQCLYFKLRMSETSIKAAVIKKKKKAAVM